MADHPPIRTENELAGLALALGARDVRGMSSVEEALAVQAVAPSDAIVREAKKRMRAGEDPLGEAFSALRSPEERRPSGATYTPAVIVDAMIEKARTLPAPMRIVDPGSGSARFLVAAAEVFKKASLVGVECDPLAALIGRAHLAARGFAARAEIIVGDYRSVALPNISGRTLFIGNPPYVRHHQISPTWKAWLAKTALKCGQKASGLSGLHVHFFLATLTHAQPGDHVLFVTASEWLDVHYGRLVRSLFLDALGGESIHLVLPTAAPFPDALTTAVITVGTVGEKPATVFMKKVGDAERLGDLSAGRRVPRARLATASRWTTLFSAPKKIPAGFVELGELCRVHRGQVTGANRVWIAGEHSQNLPECVLFPTITKAKELIAAGPVLADARGLRRVIDLPVNLDRLSPKDRREVERFLVVARSMGADHGWIAEHRRAWWSVGLRDPAPILLTYMARRAPAFVRNLCGARHINIAHGIYPREPMSDRALTMLVRRLTDVARMSDGRTYAGGLVKFEPSEVERLLVPDPRVALEGTIE